jgi:putative flippase GtrA
MRVLDAYTKGLIIGGLTVSVLVFLSNYLGLPDVNYSLRKALSVAIAFLAGSLLARVLFFRWFSRR